MFRINGTGIGFAGVSKPDKEGNCTATSWFQIFFLPIFPIARYKIHPIAQLPFRFQYKVLAKEKLVLKEIAKTYLYGWVLIPFFVFVPFLLVSFMATPEAEASLKIPQWTQIPFMVAGICWLIVTVWKLKGWDYNRWFKKS